MQSTEGRKVDRGLCSLPAFPAVLDLTRERMQWSAEEGETGSEHKAVIRASGAPPTSSCQALVKCWAVARLGGHCPGPQLLLPGSRGQDGQKDREAWRGLSEKDSFPPQPAACELTPWCIPSQRHGANTKQFSETLQKSTWCLPSSFPFGTGDQTLLYYSTTELHPQSFSFLS